MGFSVPGTDTWSWLRAWPGDPLTLALLLAAASLYAAGLLRLRRAGTPFPARWTAAYWCGLAVLAIALLSPVDTYADASFSVHMTQHLLLTFVAPPLLALGAPITLALRASSPTTGRRIGRVLRSPLARILSNPIVGWSLFVGVPFAIHLSPLFDASLRSSPVHALEHALWIVAALVYWWPIVGRDPNPHPVTYPVRMLSLFLAMPLMSFLALALYQGTTPLYPSYAALPAPWGPRALTEQRWAALQMWLAGNLALMIAILVVAVAWKRAEDEGQRRLEARIDAVNG
ncbi:MAG TPA: cytochrome c oxidase assembly protein [Actinomycetota bacterium]|nr:cytochrome c oxidase assembly protein [Actinomycetota bacterium]